MEQRVSLITLGTTDLARARAFYERLGWQADGAVEPDMIGDVEVLEVRYRLWLDRSAS